MFCVSTLFFLNDGQNFTFICSHVTSPHRLVWFNAPRAAPPIDGLLFLQCRAGDRRLRAGGVLVSSQAGCLCFWSVTGQTHTCGEPGEVKG